MSYGPITSPYFAQSTPWPYIKGPNYTRPVFGENTRGGAFMVQPIVRMPALNGLGCMQAPGSPLDILGRLQGVTYRGCGDTSAPITTPATPATVAPTPTAATPTDPTSSLPPTPPLTPQLLCDSVKTADANSYAECLAFNTNLVNVINTGNNADLTKLNDQMAAATTKCASQTDPNAWAKCYYDALEAPPWYKNPLYIGGAIVGGAVVLGLLTRWVRANQGY